jgi:hypothetical protein
MQDLKLSERIALIGLDGKESEHKSTAKQSVLKAIAAAIYLEDNYDSTTNTWKIDRDGIKDAIKTSKLKVIEQKTVKSLESKDLMSKVKSLLGCDLYYDENIKLKEYVSDTREFECQLDLIRAEFLEEGQISDEGIILVWLLREALCIHDFFSILEQDKLAIRMSELCKESTLAKDLFPIEIRTVWGTIAMNYLRIKSQIASTETGKGINFIFPFIERKQSIFIDTEEYFPNAQMRLQNVLDRVASQGHSCEVLRAGNVPVVKIDNIKYELVPEAILMKIPIHGVRLRRYNY